MGCVARDGLEELVTARLGEAESERRRESKINNGQYSSNYSFFSFVLFYLNLSGDM